MNEGEQKFTPPATKGNPEQVHPYMMLLRHALDTKDFAELRVVIDAIQGWVHGPAPMVGVQPLSDRDLQSLLDTGKGEIYVGTGTNGQRIFIENGKLFMPEGFEESQKLGQRYHDRFRAFFNIPEGQELRLKF